MNELSYWGWTSVFFGAPVFLLLVIAGVLGMPIALLYRNVPALWAHGVLGFFFLLSVGAMVATLGKHADEIRKIGEVRLLAPQYQLRLAEFLSDDSADVRYEAAFQTWKGLSATPLREAKLLTALLEATDDPDVRVRIWVCGALGKFGDKKAIPALLGALVEPEEFVRYRAAEALGDLRAKEAVEPLLRRTREDSWYVGSYSLAALREIAPERF